MIELPLLTVEVIHESNEESFIESVVSKPLPDMGPVLLFHMGVIVLVVWSASSKLHGSVSLVEVSDKMPIEELRAVVAVKAKQGERQGVFDILDLLKDFLFPFSPDCSLFSPTGGNIDGVDGIGELAQEAFSAVGDGIGLEESWFCLIPLVGLNGDLFFEEGAGFGGGSSSTSVFYSGGC